MTRTPSTRGGIPYWLRYIEVVAWAAAASSLVIGLVVNTAFACWDLQTSTDNSGGFSGTTRWHWLPPGRSCATTVDGRLISTNPSWFSLLCLVLLIAWAAHMVARAVYTRRASRLQSEAL